MVGAPDNHSYIKKCVKSSNCTKTVILFPAVCSSTHTTDFDIKRNDIVM